MSTAVFLGPTLPRDEAAAVLPGAHFFPPARAGDVHRVAATGRYEAVLLVDGVFGTVPAVWHKEVLDACHRGIRVVGCSSMGALRAVECAPFGMVGIGEVYEAYRSGVTEDDDDVAVAHLGAEEYYAALTVPMVNLRRALRRAREQGLVDAEQAGAVERAAKEMFYATRTWQRLGERLAASGCLPDPEGFVRFAASPENDAKALDCLAALRLVASFEGSAAGPAAPAGAGPPAPPAGARPPAAPAATERPAAPEETAFWARLRREVDFPEVGGWADDDGTHPVGIEERLDVVRAALLDPAGTVLGRDRRLFVHLVQQAAASLGIVATPAHVQERSELERRRLGLLDAARTRAWLAAKGMTAREWQRALAFEVVLDRLAAEYVEDLRSHVPLLVALAGGWAGRHEKTGATLDPLPSGDELTAAVTSAYERLGLPPAPDLPTASRGLGFTSLSEFCTAVLAAAPHAKDEGER